MARLDFHNKVIPDQIFDACQDRGISLDRINSMTPKERFVEYCQWHGLINWGNTLWDLVKES